MENVLEVVFGLMLAMALLVALAEKLKIPYPILLVIGGLAIGFIPGLPKIELEPEIVFVLFLPPIIQQAAYFTPIRDFKANLRPIILLSVWLVLVTTLVVGVIGHYMLGLSWPVAFVLGAIVSPPDAAAATSVMEHMKLPRRVVTILEGESLVNDASSLVLYKVAVAAVVTGAFSFSDALLHFVVASVGGVLLGWGLGWLAVRLSHKFIGNGPVFILISFLVSFGAYLLGEEIGVSGVLTVVALGIYLGQNLANRQSPQLRMANASVWATIIFLFNGLIFILIGLQLRNILEELRSESAWLLMGQATLICLTVIVVRFVWVFPATYLPRYFSAKLRARDPSPPWQAVVIIAWTGMRGVVSLAAALSLPLMTDQNTPFPERDLIIFLTFCVIFVTLVFQGLTLPFIIRLLGIPEDSQPQEEENLARLAAAQAGSERLAELALVHQIPEAALTKIQHGYEKRIQRYSLAQQGEVDQDLVVMYDKWQQLQQELMLAEFGAVLRLRDTGTINDVTLRVVQKDFDLQQIQLDNSASGRQQLN